MSSSKRSVMARGFPDESLNPSGGKERGQSGRQGSPPSQTLSRSNVRGKGLTAGEDSGGGDSSWAFRVKRGKRMIPREISLRNMSTVYPQKPAGTRLYASWRSAGGRLERQRLTAAGARSSAQGIEAEILFSRNEVTRIKIGAESPVPITAYAVVGDAPVKFANEEPRPECLNGVSSLDRKFSCSI